jgi:alpha-L-fucosidase
VPLRPGWFWHPEQKGKTKTPEQLFQLYLKSVGRGAALDLGIAPDTRGLLDEEDVKALEGFGRIVSQSFSNNLLKTASISAKETRGKDYSIKNLTDDNIRSYWASNDQALTPVIEVKWKTSQTFDLIRMREYIPLGQRLDKVEVEILSGNQWVKVGEATSVGACRIIHLSNPVETNSLRIKFQSPVAVTLSDLGIYKKIPGN